MKVIRAVYGGTAKINYILPIKLEINVLEADLLRIVIAAVDQMTAKLPLGEILGTYQREQIALCERLVERV